MPADPDDNRLRLYTLETHGPTCRPPPTDTPRPGRETIVLLLRFADGQRTAVGAPRADGDGRQVTVEGPVRRAGPRRATANPGLTHAVSMRAEQILAPVVDWTTVIGTGINYADHAAEARRGRSGPARSRPGRPASWPHRRQRPNLRHPHSPSGVTFR